MDGPARPYRLGVIGDPVAHSQSPALHRALLAGARLAGSSEAISVPKGAAAAELARLVASGFDGLAVTTPLKEEVAALCESLDPAASRAGAVSAIYLGRAGVRGANFDGLGAVAALQLALSVSLEGRTVAVLGAGATARATIGALLDARARVLVWNRTETRARKLAERFDVEPWSDEAADAIFSTLPPGADIPGPILERLVACQTIVDANYGERATLGARLGRNITGGSEMLATGARAAFDWWLAQRRSAAC